MEKTIALPYTEFAADLTFELVAQPVTCSICGERCPCEGYDGENLVYRCIHCDSTQLDALAIDPLFACDPLEAATHRHYEIACPYCKDKAVLVGGNRLLGLFFVCKNRCHQRFARFIRRY